jgi:hypothetical protein
MGYSNVYDFGGILDWPYETISDPILSNLLLSSGALSPAFSSAITQYTASVANSVTSVTLTPSTASANASISVNGMNVTSGSASGAVNLNVGANTITIIVKNSDGSTTYTVTATRELGSESPRLTGLQLSSGTLSPAFSSTTTQYTASVANTAASITVTPTASAGALISINGANVASGSASGAIILNVGSNNITIVVGNATSSTTYIVTVTRASGDGGSYWLDVADTSWWDTASSASSFTISTPQQFAGIFKLLQDRKTYFSGKTITLAGDINLAGKTWEPTVESAFQGVFDGGGHAISNLYIYSSAIEIGLFGTIASSGTIKNVRLTNVDLTVCPT